MCAHTVCVWRANSSTFYCQTDDTALQVWLTHTPTHAHTQPPVVSVPQPEGVTGWTREDGWIEDNSDRVAQDWGGIVIQTPKVIHVHLDGLLYKSEYFSFRLWHIVNMRNWRALVQLHILSIPQLSQSFVTPISVCLKWIYEEQINENDEEKYYINCLCSVFYKHSFLNMFDAAFKLFLRSGL